MCGNLAAEMARRGISFVDLGRTTGRTPRSMQDKTTGKFPFTYPEAKKIRDAHFEGLTLEYLFAETDDHPTTE